MPRIRILEGQGAGTVIEIPGRRATIGRDATNLIAIADPKSSRTHAELEERGGRWHLTDLDSSNGTWHQHGRVTSMPLTDGSTFRIGRTIMRLETQVQDATQADGLEGLDPAVSALFAPDGAGRINTYLTLLHRIVLKTNQAEGRDALFEILDDAAAEALEGDRCAVFLPAADGWSLWPAHEKRLRARYGAVPFARTLLGSPRIRREPLLCTVGGQIAPSQSMVSAGVQAAMAAPLRIGDEVHALLYVDRIEGTRPFTRADLEFLAAVANQLAVRLHNQSEVAELAREVARLKSAPRRLRIDIIGEDPALKHVTAFIGKAAPTNAPVLILGESGTGKELVARQVHLQSRRCDKPLQVVNCAAIAENLVESTLFGHMKGAFTGADETRPGLFELAHEATLFLDEIGELPMGVQAKLLRALEQGEVQRVGDGTARRVDVRLIAATNRDLKEEAAAGRFRTDLLHRLDVLCVSLPPLRERPGDIDRLADHFLSEAAARLGQERRRLSPEARTALLRYPWPGNIRQLKNAIERACILAPGTQITPEDLPSELRDEPAQIQAATPIAPLAVVERSHILRVLAHCGGNKKQAAEILDIDRSTLYAKLRSYGEG